MKYDPSDLLFPSFNDKKIPDGTSVVFIGSCLSESIYNLFISKNEKLDVDFILVNNIVEPTNEQREKKYDLRIIQIPLRSVLGDDTIKYKFVQNVNDASTYLTSVLERLRCLVENHIKFCEPSSITLLTNFIVPQGITAPSLSEIGTNNDLREIVRKLNQEMVSLCQESKLLLFDVEMIAESIGKINFLDDFLSFSFHGSVYYPDWVSHEKYPAWTKPEKGRIEDIPDLEGTLPCKHDDFFNCVISGIIHYYNVYLRKNQIKIVIYDLDNTLWRGLIAEHYDGATEKPYSDGWPLGIWESVHVLKSRGILVGLCSKNDFSIVEKNWDIAVDPPFVKLSDFDFVEIGWTGKAKSIEKILNDAKLTDLNCIFVDDNPVERESVKAILPRVIVTGSNPFLTKRELLWSTETQLAFRTNETINKSKLISEVVNRDKLRSEMDQGDFLASLSLKLSASFEISSEFVEFARVFELINKTNQFNTNGVRWTNSMIASLFKEGGKIVWCKAQDKFSDYGLIAVGIYNKTHINQIVMSCRVIGLGIEQFILSKIVADIWNSEGNKCKITASILETEKNIPCRAIYKNAGFEERISNGSRFYTLPENINIPVPLHITY